MFWRLYETENKTEGSTKIVFLPRNQFWHAEFIFSLIKVAYSLCLLVFCVSEKLPGNLQFSKINSRPLLPLRGPYKVKTPLEDLFWLNLKLLILKDPTTDFAATIWNSIEFLEIETRKIFIGLPVFKKPFIPARTLHILTYLNYPIAHTLFEQLHVNKWKLYCYTSSNK